MSVIDNTLAVLRAVTGISITHNPRAEHRPGPGFESAGATQVLDCAR